MGDSDESSSLSQDGSSQSESEDYNEPEEMGPTLESEAVQPSEEEPLYQGSNISKILSFILTYFIIHIDLFHCSRFNNNNNNNNNNFICTLN